jgi:hypothetical protein
MVGAQSSWSRDVRAAKIPRERDPARADRLLPVQPPIRTAGPRCRDVKNMNKLKQESERGIPAARGRAARAASEILNPSCFSEPLNWHPSLFHQRRSCKRALCPTAVGAEPLQWGRTSVLVMTVRYSLARNYGHAPP